MTTTISEEPKTRPQRKPPVVWFTVRGFPIHKPRPPRQFFGEMSGG